jgi:hypothetical protein
MATIGISMVQEREFRNKTTQKFSIIFDKEPKHFNIVMNVFTLSGIGTNGLT